MKHTCRHMHMGHVCRHAHTGHTHAHVHGAYTQAHAAHAHGAHMETHTGHMHAGTRTRGTRRHAVSTRGYTQDGLLSLRLDVNGEGTSLPSRQKLQGLGCPEYPAPTQEPVKGVRADLVVVSCAPPGRPRPARLSHAGPESPLTTHCAVLPSKSSCLHRADSGGGLQPEAHSPAPGRAAMWSDFGKDVLFPQLLSMLPSPAQAGGEWGWVRVPPSPGCPTPTSRSWGPAPRLLAPSHQQWVHQEGTSLTTCGRAKTPGGGRVLAPMATSVSSTGLVFTPPLAPSSSNKQFIIKQQLSEKGRIQGLNQRTPFRRTR